MSQTQALRAWIDERANEMAALLMDLVALNTENPPGRGLGACARALHDAMERLDIATDLIQIPPSGTLEDPCILRSEVGDGPETVYFHGHYDVVPAQSPEQFQPRREDGRIIGRGTADMKGGLVSMLYGEQRRAISGCSRTAGSSSTSSVTRRRGASPDPATCANTT